MANKDEKFDSFLKRTLNSKVYLQVKLSEPCIISKAKEKHTFRYVFFTDQCLYLTENPPKTILFSLPFNSFRDVQVVHDHAKFLQKELREIAQHILVKFVSANKSFESSKSGLDQSKHSKTQQPSNSKLHNHSSLKIDSSNSIWRNIASTFNRSASPKLQPSHTPGSTTEIVATNDNDSLCGLGNNRSTTPSKDFYASYADFDASSRTLFANDSVTAAAFDGNFASKSSSVLKKWTAADTHDVYIVENEKLPICDLHLYILNGASVFYAMLRSVWKAFLLLCSFLPCLLPPDESLEQVKMCRGGALPFSVNCIYVYLRCYVFPAVLLKLTTGPLTWSSRIAVLLPLLSTTLAVAASYKEKHTEKLSKENFTKPILNALKNDILRCFQNNSSIEDVYRCFLELKSVLKESLLCKAYFWKDRDMFCVIVNFLSKFSKSTSQDHLTKMDEIECMILICETLAEMLRQTETTNCCIETLQTLRPEIFSNLITSLLRPERTDHVALDEEMQSLLREYTSVICEALYELVEVADRISWSNQTSNSTFSTSFLLTQMDMNSNLLDFLKSVISLCVRIWTTEAPKSNDSLRLNPTNHPSAAPSGLLDASHHSVNYSGSSHLQLSPSHPSNHLGSSPHSEPLSAQNVVVVYRSLSVIYRCFSKCKSVKDVYKETFKEEFKYYIRPEHSDLKLSEAYPAAGITRNMVKGVACLVLDQTAASSTSHASAFE